MKLKLETRQYPFYFTNVIMASKADEFTECHGINNLTINDKESIEICSNQKIQLTPNDVIFGRGRKSDNHGGNVQFRCLINSKFEAYMAACDDLTKTIIAEGIVKQVLTQNGRFLKWVDGAWLIADNQSAIQKVLKTLCNKVHSNRKLAEDPHCVDSEELSQEQTLQSKLGSSISDMGAISCLDLTVSSLSALCWLLKAICKDSELNSTLKSEILKAVLWTLAFASSGNQDCIQAVINTTNCLDNLITIMHEGKDTNIVIPALETVANIVTGNACQVQEVIKAGFLDIAEYLLESKTQDICKKACTILSCISSGTQAQVHEVLNQEKVVILLIKYTGIEHLEVRTEAILVISNLFTHGSDLHVQHLVQAEGLAAMCDVLEGSGDSDITLALDAIENILTVGERHDLSYICAMNNCGGIDKLEKVQEHDNDDIHEKALHLLEKFFEEDNESQNPVPAIN